MAQYRSPPPFNFQEPKWTEWRALFMTFRLVTKLHAEDEEVQVASLTLKHAPCTETVHPRFSC